MVRKLFANPQNVNTNMKKYISPIAKEIRISAESLLATSGEPEVHNGLGKEGEQDSNRRRNSIWGDEY